MQTLMDVLNSIYEGLIEPLYYFSDPEKRINYLYLASSILLAYYVYYKSKINAPFYKYLFNRKVWLSRSAFIDYKYFFFNGLIKILFIVPLIEAWRYLGIETTFYLEESFGLFSSSLSQNQVLILYSLSVVVAYDLVFYLVHLSMHKIPFLWEFHKIHHSATSLNPITQYRLHPVELVINNVAYILVSSTLMGVFDYFYVGSIQLVLFAQANIFTLLFLFWGANLRHSHVKLKYFNFLEKFLISPYQHQIHHSDNPKHFDKNMGAKLALWDWFFGTLLRSKDSKKLHFGLGKRENVNYSNFVKSLYMPFVNIGRFFLKRK